MECRSPDQRDELVHARYDRMLHRANSSIRLTFYQKTGAISLFHGDVKSRQVRLLYLCSSERCSQRAAVAVLEDIPDERKDWHPVAQTRLRWISYILPCIL